MTVDVLVRIQHHPARADILDRLTSELGGLRYEVITDPEPDAPRRSAFRTFRECMEREWEGTHLLIIQDDAIPGLGFAEALPRVIEARPDTIVCLFLAHQPGRTRAAAIRAWLAREHWADFHPLDWVPTVASVYPRDVADRFARWAPAGARRGEIGDDSIMGRFCRHNRVRAVATVPSIVEHPDDVPSVVRNRGPNNNFRAPRRAAIFDAEIDARVIDWA